MKKIILTERQFNNNKKYLIREYLEALKGDNANSALRAINNLYQRVALQIEQGKPHIEETTTVFQTMVKVRVSNRFFETNWLPKHHGEYIYNLFENHIEIKFNVKAASDYEEFKEVILHELTHHFDDNRNRINADPKVELLYNLFDGIEDQNATNIQRIIYKLWMPTERNAFTTQAIGGNKNIDIYIQSLQTKIEEVRKTDWSDPKYISMWENIKKMMGLPYKTTQYKTIDIFCKKSTYLLKKFKKKALQRRRQHAMDPENQYDTSAKLTMELLQAKQQIRKFAREYRDDNVDLQQFIQMLKDEKLITNYNQEELIQFATQQFNEQQEDKTRELAFDHFDEDPEEFAQLAIEQGVKLDKQTIIDIYTNFPNRR